VALAHRGAAGGGLVAGLRRPHIRDSLATIAFYGPMTELRRSFGLPLRTRRLRLRHFVLADAPSIMALNAEASTRRWLPSHVYASLDDAVAALGFLISCYAAPGSPQLAPYVLAVEQASTRELLGHVGFSPLDDEVEVSYAIAEAARGRGYAAEALVHACDWLADVCRVPSVLAITASANVASRRLLERASFAHVRDEPMRFQGVEQTVSRYRRRATTR
jgi:RimJ/RimL family protein N-acetyltransferase